MKIKEIIIRFCIWIITMFIALVVPFVCFIVPLVIAIYESPWFLLFYIVTLPLAFIWYSIMRKMWKDIKNDLLEDLLEIMGEDK